MCSRPNQCCSAGHGVSGEPGPSCGRTRPKLEKTMCVFLLLDSKFSELIWGGNSLKAVVGFVGFVYQKHLWILTQATWGPPSDGDDGDDDDTCDDSDCFMWSRIIFRPFLFLFIYKRVPVYSGDTGVGCTVAVNRSSQRQSWRAWWERSSVDCDVPAVSYYLLYGSAPVMTVC